MSLGTTTVAVRRIGAVHATSNHSAQHDDIAAEEPLEIRLAEMTIGERLTRTLSITMRSPGEDRELAFGYLFAEGVIANAADVENVRMWNADDGHTVLRVQLAAGIQVNWERLKRAVPIASSCGVCGKTSTESLLGASTRVQSLGTWQLDPQIIHSLSASLRQGQAAFGCTGGMHAAALFDLHGRLLALREDVGRHNALDKLIGWSLARGELPWNDRMVMVSGRAGFELAQKASAAGAPVLAAVGAPSSSGVRLAQARGLTLLGFVRDGRFNIYSGDERIADEKESWRGGPPRFHDTTTSQDRHHHSIAQEIIPSHGDVA